METGDITLERVKLGHLNALRETRNSKFVLNSCWDTRPATKEGQQRWYNAIVESNSRFEYCICRGGGIVGKCSLNVDVDNRRAEFGIYVGEEFAGLGIATVAMQQLLHIGFGAGLHKIYGQVFDFNRRALRFYEKLGFKREATLKDQLYRDGRFYDVHIVSMFGEKNE